MKKKLLFIFIYFAYPTWVLAQLDNSAFDCRYLIDEADSNKVIFGFRSMSFLKNNEYFNKIADGYTLFGYQLAPYLSYYPAKNVRVDAGFFLKKDFGADSFTDVFPTFTVKVDKGNFSLLFGNIEGSLDHNLIEPLYDFENVVTDRLEYGLQTLYDGDQFSADFWVDWEKMIFPGDSEQEEITGGLTVDYTLFSKGRFDIVMPFQLFVYHRGGQIDVNPDPLVTLTNSALGLKFNLAQSNGSFLKSFSIDGYFVSHGDNSPEPQQTFDNGTGQYFNLIAVTKHNLQLMTTYWHGSNFQSIKGGQLYQSISSSIINDGEVEPDRDLLIARFTHTWPIAQGISLTTRVEPYYDFGNNLFEFSHGFYLNLHEEFFLLKNKKRR